MFRKILQWLGVIFLVQGLVIVGLFVYLQFGSQTYNTESKKMKRFDYVLNWSHLNPDQDYKVVDSYKSSVSPILGDYSKWACIDVSEMSGVELLERWDSGPEEFKLYSRLRMFGAGIGGGDACFGSDVNVNSKSVSVLFRSISLHGRENIEGATMIFYHKLSKRILYVEWMS